MVNPTTQNDFVDALKSAMRSRTDKELCLDLEMDPSQLSHIRHGRESVSSALRIVIHEATGWSFAKMREMLGEVEKLTGMKG